MKIDLERLEFSGVPFELLKNMDIHFAEGIGAQALDEILLPQRGEAKQIHFLLKLLRVAMEDREFIQKNSDVLVWYLPIRYTQCEKDSWKEQRKLLKRLVRIHDFARCLSVYLKSCQNSLRRSESSASQKLKAITDNWDTLEESIKVMIRDGGTEFWRCYQEESINKKEDFPTIPRALVRVVCNNDKLYPSLPAVYSLHIIKKMGNSSEIRKESLLEMCDTVGCLDFRKSAFLPHQAKRMAERIGRSFYDKMGTYLYFATRKKRRTTALGGYTPFGDFLMRQKTKKEDKGVLTLTSASLLPVCKVRKFALDMGIKYDLSSEEIMELHQKLPGYLYSAKPGPYMPQLSEAHLEAMMPILNAMRELCSPRYYSFSEKSQLADKEKGINKLKEGNFVKKYIKFCDPTVTILFCCAPIPIELATGNRIAPHSSYIQEELWDNLEKEFNESMKGLKGSDDAEDSIYFKPLNKRWKEVLTLQEAMDFLEQFLDGSDQPQVILKQYVMDKGDEQLKKLWERCVTSKKIAVGVYARTLRNALELVCAAGMGIYYRAVFCKYGAINP